MPTVEYVPLEPTVREPDGGLVRLAASTVDASELRATMKRIM
jgi:hypothetical protein